MFFPLFRAWFLFILFWSMLQAGSFTVNIMPSMVDEKTLGIKILDQKQIVYNTIDGIKFSEISDLAYDTKTHSLFMVSDEGKLFEFKTEFADKIKEFTPVRSGKLRKKSGKKFKKWRRDSEGMTLDGQGRLLISFEEKPKIAWFHKNSAKYGRLIHKYPLPKKLRKMKYFRSKNKGLEALA